VKPKILSERLECEKCRGRTFKIYVNVENPRQWLLVCANPDCQWTVELYIDEIEEEGLSAEDRFVNIPSYMWEAEAIARGLKP
jgi:hypothetical protein